MAYTHRHEITNETSNDKSAQQRQTRRQFFTRQRLLAETLIKASIVNNDNLIPEIITIE